MIIETSSMHWRDLQCFKKCTQIFNQISQPDITVVRLHVRGRLWKDKAVWGFTRVFHLIYGGLCRLLIALYFINSISAGAFDVFLGFSTITNWLLVSLPNYERTCLQQASFSGRPPTDTAFNVHLACKLGQ